MKRILLLLALTTTISFGQVKTTTQDGDFWSLLTWDCFCLPADGDSLVINHDLTLTTGIAYNSGQIYIGSGGSLDDGANTFSFYINGGSLVNDGTLIIDNLVLDNTGGFIENHGNMMLDSVWTRSTATNTGNLTTDAFVHDEGATFTNTGNMTIQDNFNNQGVFINTGLMTGSHDASNCNIQSLNATIQNDGIWCLEGNFTNCTNDTLLGDGVLYIGGTSTNAGQVEGNLTINTSGGAFDFNTGTVTGSVVFGTAVCGVGVEDYEEDEEMDWTIFPNPATTVINSSEMNVKYSIYDLSGKRILAGVTFNGQIHVDALEEGNYLIQLENSENQTTTKTFIKL